MLQNIICKKNKEGLLSGRGWERRERGDREAGKEGGGDRKTGRGDKEVGII